MSKQRRRHNAALDTFCRASAIHTMLDKAFWRPQLTPTPWMPQKHAPSAALPLQPRVRVPQWLTPSTIPVEYLHSYGAGTGYKHHLSVCAHKWACVSLRRASLKQNKWPNTCECPLTISPLCIDSPLHRDREAHFNKTWFLNLETSNYKMFNVSAAFSLWLAAAAASSWVLLQFSVDRWQASLVAPVGSPGQGANQGPLFDM